MFCTHMENFWGSVHFQPHLLTNNWRFNENINIHVAAGTSRGLLAQNNTREGGALRPKTQAAHLCSYNLTNLD